MADHFPSRSKNKQRPLQSTFSDFFLKKNTAAVLKKEGYTIELIPLEQIKQTALTLQGVRFGISQNVTVCLLTVSPVLAHVWPILHQLHWLPTEYPIFFKVLVRTFKAMCGLGPIYLKDSLSPYMPQRTLYLTDHHYLTDHRPQPGSKSFLSWPTRNTLLSIVTQSATERDWYRPHD